MNRLLIVIAVAGCFFLSLFVHAYFSHEAEEGWAAFDWHGSTAATPVFLKNVAKELNSIGFTPSEPFSPGIVGLGGLKDSIYWYKGSYNGSSTIYLRVIVTTGTLSKSAHAFSNWRVWEPSLKSI